MHFYRKSWDELVEFRQSFNGSPDTITGHEPCGVVEAVGANVTSVAPGDRVTVYQHVGCERCGSCRRGEVMFCPERTGYGSVHDGSSADYTLAPGAQLHAHPGCAELRPRRGALLRRRHGRTSRSSASTLPAPTRWASSGLARWACARRRSRSRAGARVVGLDLQPERLRLARAMGAERVIDVSCQDAGRGVAGDDRRTWAGRRRRLLGQPAGAAGDGGGGRQVGAVGGWSASASRSSWTHSVA